MIRERELGDTGAVAPQRALYRFNRARLRDPEGGDAHVLAFERRWIADWLAELSPADGGPKSLAELQQRIAQRIAEESNGMTGEASYVAETMPREAFRVLVQEFAVDGLTEAQSFYYVLPRLTLEAQMPMLRIMIDEFGSGNLKRAHTSLYLELLHELHMPTDLDFYAERAEPNCLAFVNLFFWLTLRASDASYFAGAITYLESAIPNFFECYVQACHRLGIQAHGYYSEHQHIDAFHAVEGQRLLRAMEATRSLDPAKAWLGVVLASANTGRAFETAVAKARTTTQAAPPGAEHALR
jgi:hypothetical protein